MARHWQKALGRRGLKSLCENAKNRPSAAKAGLMRKHLRHDWSCPDLVTQTLKAPPLQDLAAGCVFWRGWGVYLLE
jgi:hypothetical protein